MYSGRLTSNSGLASDGVPVVMSLTAGLRVLLAAAHVAGDELLMALREQLGSWKYPPTPLEVPLLSRPRNRSSRPPDMGSIALAALAPWAAIAVGSFSSPTTTQEPGAVNPMSDRKVERVPEPTCGMIGTIGLVLPPTWFQFVSVQL